MIFRQKRSPYCTLISNEREWLVRQNDVGLVEPRINDYFAQAMECSLCSYPKTHKHGKMPNGHQRYFCPECKQTFSESFDTLYNYRHMSPAQIQQVLQAHSEGNGFRGISRINVMAYDTVVSIVRSASVKAQLV